MGGVAGGVGSGQLWGEGRTRVRAWGGGVTVELLPLFVGLNSSGVR